MLKIEKATQKELEQVAQIESELFTIPWSKQAFEETQVLEHVLFLVAKNDKEEVVGYCVLYQALDEAEITNVGVKKSAQKNGIGNRLIASVKENAKERNIQTIFLEVRISNQSAIHLYEKQGFEVIGTRKNFYERPTEDAYVMKYESSHTKDKEKKVEK